MAISWRAADIFISLVDGRLDSEYANSRWWLRMIVEGGPCTTTTRNDSCDDTDESAHGLSHAVADSD